MGSQSRFYIYRLDSEKGVLKIDGNLQDLSLSHHVLIQNLAPLLILPPQPPSASSLITSLHPGSFVLPHVNPQKPI